MGSLLVAAHRSKRRRLSILRCRNPFPIETQTGFNQPRTGEWQLVFRGEFLTVSVPATDRDLELGVRNSKNSLYW